MLLNGKIKADSWNIEISGKTSEDEFLCSELKNDIKTLVFNGVYRSYYTGAYDVYGRRFSFRVYFKNGVLDFISLIPVPDVVSWDNVEASALEKNKKENEVWLLNQFGITTPSTFSWGTIESTVDQRGGFSCIVIRFQVHARV